jgi:hypothetical protein
MSVSGRTREHSPNQEPTPVHINVVGGYRIDPRDRIELSPSGHESEVLPLHYRGSLTDCY